jgi:Rieske Fe-S protein
MQSKIGRRRFLVSSGWGVGILVFWPELTVWAAGKIAIPMAKVPAVSSVGGSVALKVKDKLLLLVRDGPETIRALNPICTHRKCVVAYSAAKKIIECPCHGSEYDLDGHVLKGPAPSPLQTYPAELSGDQVVVTM